MERTQEAGAIRAQVEKARSCRRGRNRYSQTLRLRILDYVARARAQEQRLAVIAAKLGIGWQTIEYWRRRDNSDAADRRSCAQRFLQIQVTEEVSKRQQIVVHGPRGTRIEGLSLEQVGELLRSLG